MLSAVGAVVPLEVVVTVAVVAVDGWCRALVVVSVSASPPSSSSASASFANLFDVETAGGLAVRSVWNLDNVN